MRNDFDASKTPERPMWMNPDYEPGLVSVIVPTYNRGDLIVSTLDSVAAQCYCPLELIVVDDGSTDATREIASSWAARLGGDPPFQVRYVYQDNGGEGSARNRGLLASLGEFIQYLDSDDFLAPTKLRKHVEVLQNNPQLDYVYCPSEIRRNGKCVSLTGRPIPMGAETAWITSYNWTVMGPLYRRRVCCAVGPWSERRINSQDLLYEARVKAVGFKGHFDREVLTIWNLHQGPHLSTTGGVFSARSSETVAAQLAGLLRDNSVVNKRAWNTISRYLVRAALLFGIEGDDASRSRCLRDAAAAARGSQRYMIQAIAAVVHVLPPRSLSAALHALASLRRCKLR